MKGPTLLIVAVALLLAGCEVIVSGLPPTRPVREPLRVVEATYETNFRDQDGRYLICDNRPTTLTYRFRYQGELSSWRSYLRGQTLGETRGDRTFYPTSREVTGFESGYEVVYQMAPYFAPYAGDFGGNLDTDEALSPQAINVVPVPQPEVIGASRLHLTLRGAGDNASYVSQDIPVVEGCPLP